MNKSTDPFDPDNLRIDPEQFHQSNQGNGETATLINDKAVSKDGGVRRYPKRAGFQFYRFPVRVFDLLLGTNLEINRTDLAVLLVLYELWFTNFQRNPVKLTSYSLRKYGISKDQKYRAVRKLESRGVITVEQTRGKNPVVILNWVPLQK